MRADAPARSLHKYGCGQKVLRKGEGRDMREVAGDFMKLLAIIMVMITLAVSTAAVSQMFG